MFNKKINSIQEWFCIEDILENGTIITKENSRVKILKVEPINFFLRSEMEKEVILNSYKNIFKSINFDIQIIIQIASCRLKICLYFVIGIVCLFC